MFKESDIPEMNVVDLEKEKFLKRCHAPVLPIMDGTKVGVNISLKKLVPLL